MRCFSIFYKTSLRIHIKVHLYYSRHVVNTVSQDAAYQWGVNISRVTFFVDCEIAVWIYVDQHWQHTQSFLTYHCMEFTNLSKKTCVLRIIPPNLNKAFLKSVTLASHFTERSTFNIEVRHILFITYFVTIKSYKKKRFHTNSSRLENNNATGHRKHQFTYITLFHWA